MTGALLPLADHGNVVSALPFVVPMILVVLGLVFLVARDRLGSGRTDTETEDSPSSPA
jgi:hypothetical protein